MSAAAERAKPGPRADTRRVGGIPIRNLYVMLAFREVLSGELSPETCGALESERLPLGILARLLADKLVWIRRRGTPRRYQVRGEVGAAPEGALDLPATLRGMHLLHQRVAYRVDELQMDTPHNRLLCAGIRALLRSPRVKDELRVELRRQLSVFTGVAYISRTDALRVDWRKAGGAASSYRAALGLARLAVLASLPDEGAHDRHWQRLLDDHKRMGELFEAFVRGFLKLEFETNPAGQRGRVRVRHFKWSDNETHELLPQMKTDIVLEDVGERWVCVGDCKLYKSPFATSYLSDKPKLHPDHLFQLFAYLEAARARYPGQAVEGLLIYGLVDRPMDVDVELRGFPVRVRAVDLTLEWPQLRAQLCKLWPATHTGHDS